MAHIRPCTRPAASCRTLRTSAVILAPRVVQRSAPAVPLAPVLSIATPQRLSGASIFVPPSVRAFSSRSDIRYRSLENAQFSALMQRGLAPSSALRMFQLRKEAGFQPDASSYTALISSFLDGGRGDQALHLFEELLASGEEMTLAAYNTGMGLYAKRNQLDRVLVLYEKMRGAQIRPTEETFNVLIEACTRAYQFQRAQDFFAEMKTHGLQPDATGYNLILGHAVRTKKLDFALEFYEQMQRDGISASRDTLLLMMEASARKNQLDKAMAMCEALLAERWVPSAHAVTQLIVACSRLQRTDVALDLFENLKRATAPSQPHETAYAELISLLAARDQLVIARDYLAEMVRVGYAPGRNTYHALINGYTRSSLPNGLQEAEQLFDEMKATGVAPTEISCACLMQVYRIHKALPKALALYDFTKTVNLPPSPLLLDALITLACEQGAYADAERVFEEAQATTPSPPVLLNSTWLALAQMQKAKGNAKSFQDFAKRFGPLLKRRAVLMGHGLLSAEIASLEHTP